AEICSWTLDIQKTLFRVGSALADPREAEKSVPTVTAEDVDHLTELVHSIEAKEGILSDWSLPGSHTGAASFDVARTVCRRAERCIVRLSEPGPAIPLIRPTRGEWLVGFGVVFGTFFKTRAGNGSPPAR